MGDEATIATSEDVSSVRLRASQSRQQEQLTCFHFWMKAIYSFAVRTFVTSPQFRIYKSTTSFKKFKGGLFPRLLTPYKFDMADDTKGKDQLGQAVVRLQK